MSNKFPQEIVDQIRTTVDIVDVISDYVNLNKKGKEYFGLCPFHQEKTPSFSVNQEKQVYNCFGCGSGGNVFSFLMQLDGLSFFEALEKLANRISLKLPDSLIQNANFTRSDEDKISLEMYERVEKYFHHLLVNTEEGREALNYLLNRGFSKESIENFRIGYAPKGNITNTYLKSCGYSTETLYEYGLVRKTEEGNYVDYFRDRIIFPIWNNTGQVIAFSGRALDDSKPKYLNSPDTKLFNKSKILYNFHKARQEIKRTGEVVLFEGFADVISAYDAGVKNGVATMGTSFTQDHLNLLSRDVRSFILCFDSDNAGTKAALSTGKVLSSRNYNVKVCNLPDNLDPDEFIKKYGRDNFKNRLSNNSTLYISYVLEKYKHGKNLNNDANKKVFLDVAVKLIVDLSPNKDYPFYINSIIEQFKEQEDYIRKIFSKYNNKSTSNPTSVINKKNTVKGLTKYNKFENAERMLLAYMFRDINLIEKVKDRIFDRFNDEQNKAILLLLYGYFEKESESIEEFINSIEDENLRLYAIEIKKLPIGEELNSEIFDELENNILVHFQEYNIKKSKQEEINQEYLNGNILKAAEMLQKSLIESRNSKFNK
ncbi:MAG: primase [Bacillales bacterium]|jgi:DNA primase|nr:primase [Bacillales bacterium]